MIFESGRCTLMLSLGSRVSSYKPQSSIRLSVKMRTFNGGCFALNKIFLGFHVLNLLSKGHSCTCQVPTKRSSDFPQCTATTSFDRRWSDSAKAKGVCPAPPSVYLRGDCPLFRGVKSMHHHRRHHLLSLFERILGSIQSNAVVPSIRRDLIYNESACFKALFVSISCHRCCVQCSCSGWPTGNGKKPSNSQACCLAQLCLAAA